MRNIIRKSAVVGASLLFLIVAGLAYIGYFWRDPIRIHPVQSRSADYALVLMSGDMGTQIGITPTLVRRFNQAGLPVLTFNSLGYFRRAKTPDQITAALRLAMERARASFGTRKLVLIGQSFGADAMQLALSKLSPGERTGIAKVFLVVPTDSVLLRASPSEIFNFGPPDLPAAPTARTITWVPLVCIHGELEAGSLCPAVRMANVERIALPGGHMLNRDNLAVYEAIATRLPATGAASKSAVLRQSAP